MEEIDINDHNNDTTTITTTNNGIDSNDEEEELMKNKHSPAPSTVAAVNEANTNVTTLHRVKRQRKFFNGLGSASIGPKFEEERNLQYSQVVLMMKMLVMPWVRMKMKENHFTSCIFELTF